MAQGWRQAGGHLDADGRYSGLHIPILSGSPSMWWATSKWLNGSSPSPCPHVPMLPSSTVLPGKLHMPSRRAEATAPLILGCEGHCGFVCALAVSLARILFLRPHSAKSQLPYREARSCGQQGTKSSSQQPVRIRASCPQHVQAGSLQILKLQVLAHSSTTTSLDEPEPPSELSLILGKDSVCWSSFKLLNSGYVFTQQ